MAVFHNATLPRHDGQVALYQTPGSGLRAVEPIVHHPALRVLERIPAGRRVHQDDEWLAALLLGALDERTAEERDA